ncbi:MAG: hypothetical protein ACKO0M_03745 [Cyanobium sp.]
MTGAPVPEARPSHSRGFLSLLQLCERQGQRCGGPILLAGLVLGAGVVELSSGPLGQTSRFSLELLMLLVLQLVGPMLVALLAMALLLPRWLEHSERHGGRAWRQAFPAALLVGALLLLLFLAGALVGGVLASPRADLIGELRDLLGGVLLSDLLRSTLRAAAFLAALCAFSQWRGRIQRGHGVDPALVSSNLLVEGLMLLLGLKLLWITVLDPLQLGGVA